MRVYQMGGSRQDGGHYISVSTGRPTASQPPKYKHTHPVAQMERAKGAYVREGGAVTDVKTGKQLKPRPVAQTTQPKPRRRTAPRPRGDDSIFDTLAQRTAREDRLGQHYATHSKHAYIMAQCYATLVCPTNSEHYARSSVGNFIICPLLIPAPPRNTRHLVSSSKFANPPHYDLLEGTLCPCLDVRHKSGTCRRAHNGKPWLSVDMA